MSWRFGKGAGFFWWSGVGFGAAAGGVVGRITEGAEGPAAFLLIVGLLMLGMGVVIAGESEGKR